MIEFETKVIDVIQRTRNVKSFRFRADNVSFEPGQFFFVTLKIDGLERTKHFSFSNSPTEKGYIEFTKRLTGSPYSKALDTIKKGDGAKIKMPRGEFTLEGEPEKISFLSGGIGITPIRSMIKFATDKKLKTDIVLLYGNSEEQDIIFKDDLDIMKEENKNLKVVYTLTSPEVKKEKWRGKTGYINAAMIKEEIPDYKERTFYICGPPKMVEALVSIAKKELSLGAEKVRTENFTGY